MSHQSDLPPHVPSCVSTGAGVTVPDATATPRTDAQIEAPNSCYDGMWVDFARTLERELTAAKAEIARLNSHEGDLVIGCAIVEGARRQEARAVDRLEADSAALRAEVERLKNNLDVGLINHDALNAKVILLSDEIAWGRAALRVAGMQNRDALGVPAMHTDIQNMAAERDQLRARVAELENDLEKSKHEADDWHRAWETVTEQAKKEVAELEQALSASATKAAAEYGEQLKPLFAKVRELEAAVAWAEQQLLGDSGTGETYWETVPGYAAFKRAARAGKGAT